MPYSVTTELSFLRIILHGVVTSQELQALADDVLAIEVSCPVTPHRLNDLSGMTDPYLTYSAVSAFVERRKAQPLANVVKSAMVAPRPVLLGFARMFQTLNKHPDIRIEIFSTIEAAEAWLREE